MGISGSSDRFSCYSPAIPREAVKFGGKTSMFLPVAVFPKVLNAEEENRVT